MGCRSDHAWAAGFVDGEGYLCLMPTHARKLDGYRNRKPKIEVSQTVRKPLEKLQALYGGTIYTMPRRSDPRRKLYWRYDLIGTKKVRHALLKMLPFMQVKAKQAELLLAFIALMDIRPVAYRTPTTAVMIKKREQIYLRMKADRKAG